MTNDLPSVGTEDAPSMANYTFTIVADSGYESTTEGRCSAKQYGAVIYALHNDDSYVEQRDSLAAERDALAGRVKELEAALKNARDDMADWVSYASDYFREKYNLAGELAAIDAALNASKEQA